MATPWPYDPAIGEEICRLLVEGKRGGPMSLAAICRKKGFPSLVTVFKWLKESPDFANDYAHARELQADANADMVQEIADTEKDHDRARIRIDARKWYAGQMKPKKYGPRAAEFNINSGGGAISMKITPEDEKAM